MSLDRRVPEQDSAQNEELTRRAKEKRDKENYDAAVRENERQNAEIDKQNAANEAKYQKDLADYNALINVKSETQKIKDEYARQINETNLENERIKAEIRSRESAINIRYGTYSSSVKEGISDQERKTSEKMAEIKRNEQRSLNVQSLRESGQVLTKGAWNTFNKTDGQVSLTTLNQNYLLSQESQAEASRRNAIQNAGFIHSGVKQTREQSKLPYVQPVTQSKSPLYTPQMQERVSAIKPTAIPKGTIYPTKPTLAQKQTGTLTNVNTGQYIDNFNKPQTNIVANPRALVAGLKRQVAPEGTPIKSPIIIGETKKTRVENTLFTGDWNGQQTKKTRLADPKIDAMIGAYGYDKTNQIIGNYNRIIDSNNLLIKEDNRKNRNEYFDFRRQQVREDKYFKSPKAQGPPKPKYETVIAAPTLNELVISNNQTPENIFIQNKYSELDKLSAKLNKEVTSDDERKLVQVGAEAGKGGLSILASIQNFGEQTVRPAITGKPPTNPPIILSSEPTSSQLFPIGEGWKLKTPGELLSTAKQQYQKYGPATFVGDVLPTYGVGAESLLRGGVALAKASPILAIVGGRQLIKQGSKIGVKTLPYVPQKIKNFGGKISNVIPSGKIKNFAERHPLVSPRTYFDLRVVKKYTKENYPDYKNISIVKEKGQRIYTTSGGVEEKRPNLPYKPVEEQLKPSTKTMNEPIITNAPRKQRISNLDKQGDLLFSIEFKKGFKVKNGNIILMEKSGSIIQRPRLPQLAKKAKEPKMTILVKKEVIPRKKPSQRKENITSIPNDLYQYLKDKANKSLRQPNKPKPKPVRIVKLDWLTEYSQPEKSMQYAKTKRVTVTSADPDFEKSALTLGMKRYGVSSFVKESPSQRFMMKLEQSKKSGLLIETAQSKEGPLQLFRINKQKSITTGKKQIIIPDKTKGAKKITVKNELTQFDFVGEKIVLGRFYEAKGGLGKSEFVKDVTKNKQLIPVGSKDLERKLGGADINKNFGLEGVEPRIKETRKLTFRSAYPTDVWIEESKAIGSGRGISLQTQRTIINPEKPAPKINTPTKIDYLSAASTYKPLTEASGSGGSFDVEEEVVRYPSFNRVNKLEYNVIPKIALLSFTGQRGEVRVATKQVSSTAQKQESALKSVLDNALTTKQKTRQKTEQVQKLKNPLAEKFGFRPVLITGAIILTKSTPTQAQSPIQALKQPQKLKTIQKLEFKIPLPNPRRTTTKPPRIRLLPFGLPKEEKKREVRKSLPGDNADFLGNVQESSVAGMFNRSEVTYGLKKISRLQRGDKRELVGRSRSAPRREAKFVEGWGKDPFGFKDNTKKGKKFRLSF
jgi:hypothetical protein